MVSRPFFISCYMDLSSSPELHLNMTEIRKGSLVLRAIDHPIRGDMLRLMHKSEEISVTEMYVKLRLEQSVASQHLAILRQCNFVQARRRGKFMYYSVNYDRLMKVEAQISRLKRQDFAEGVL